MIGQFHHRTTHPVYYNKNVPEMNLFMNNYTKTLPTKESCRKSDGTKLK